MALVTVGLQGLATHDVKRGAGPRRMARGEETPGGDDARPDLRATVSTALRLITFRFEFQVPRLGRGFKS